MIVNTRTSYTQEQPTSAKRWQINELGKQMIIDDEMFPCTAVRGRRQCITQEDERRSRLAVKELTKGTRRGSMDPSRHISKVEEGIWVISRDGGWSYRDKPSPNTRHSRKDREGK